MMREREYGIDALRIVSMWMVVILHVLGHGGILYNLGPGSFRYMVAWLLEIAAYGAVNCYGLISGYVGVNSRTKYASILCLWLQVVFYSTTLSLAAHFIWPEFVQSWEWIHGFFPVNSSYYWYYSAYFFVSFLVPVMNHALHSADKRQITGCLAALIVVASLNSSVFLQNTFAFNGGYSPIWLMLLYMMGGCIRLYGDQLTSYRWIKRHAGLVFLLSTMVTWCFKMVIENNRIPWIRGQMLTSDALISYISPTVILGSVALFAAFSAWKPDKRQCRWIGFVSPAAFGVYLIHTHPQIWKYYLREAYISFVHLKAYWLFFAVLGVAGAIFVVCAAIDLLRARLFGMLRVKEGCRALMGKIGLS